MRNYKRKPGRVNPDRRMARAAELRAEGLSQRQIAKRLSCDEKTIRNDLARWNRERPNVALLRNPSAEKPPRRGKNSAPEIRSETGNVVPLSHIRRGA
jgi:transposase